MQQFIFTTSKKRQVIDITDEVTAALPKNGSGLAAVFTPHTGAAITTANLDPGTDLDLLDFLETITPEHKWRHPHDPHHAPDHILASLIGPSVAVPYERGGLLLGTWQYIVLVEFDGPRERSVFLQTT